MRDRPRANRAFAFHYVVRSRPNRKEAISMDNSTAPRSLPRRVLVSFRLGGAFFALANVICVGIIAYAYLSAKREPRTLEVKGSAKKTIASDTVAWEGRITARDADLVKAYDKLKADSDRVSAFIRTAGI